VLDGLHKHLFGTFFSARATVRSSSPVMELVIAFDDRDDVIETLF